MSSLVERLSVAFTRIKPTDDCDRTPNVGPTLTRYFAIERERMAQVRPDFPFIGVPLSGHKEVWHGDRCQTFAAGDIFALPAGVPVDVVNVPDRKNGRYATIVFGCPAHLAANPRGALAAPADPHRPSLVRCTAEVADALVHAALVLADKDEAREVAELRMREVLLLLRNDPAVRAIFDHDRAAQVANVVRSDLSRKWSVADVAHALHLAESTLRRQLAGQATSFRAILKRERMQLAESMLAKGGTTVSEAAEAAGYASRSHFASRFRERFGDRPSSYLP